MHLVLENGGADMLFNDTHKWLTEGGYGDYKVVNTDVREYMREQDFKIFLMFIDPLLKTVHVSSAFETAMDIAAHRSFNRAWDDNRLYQLEYIITILRQAMFHRRKMGMDDITFLINYLGDDFLRDLKEQKWGWDCTAMVKLLFRQCEGLTLMLYKDFVLQKVIKTEEDLCLS